MNALLIRVFLGLALLLPMLGTACPVCRPKVQAAIHNADYVANLGLLLLPVALLLALGVALYWSEALWSRRGRPLAASSTNLAAE